MHRDPTRRFATVAALMLLIAAGTLADDTAAGRFRGSDGRFDASNYLASKGAFLPTPILVTEPALGYGGGLAAIFFHGGNPLRNRPSDGHVKPPSISAVGAIATENGSSGAAIGHFGVWRDDHVRYIGAAGTADLNLDYWGSANRPLGDPLRYNVGGALIAQRLLFRVGDSPFFAGAEMSWSTQEAEFASQFLPPDAPPRTLDQDDAGIGAVGEFETLDNIFTPTRGIKARIVGKTFSENLGGDNDRETLDVETFGYVPVHERVILGARGDVGFSDGETPFYLRPYVKLRGLPAMKYSGKHTALGELEARWNVHGRWSVVGFGGIGVASDSSSDLWSADRIGSYGAGFRYFLAEKLGLHAGVDYGVGPDDGAIYIIVGNAWR